MAHFAELDENNIVKQVIVINNDVINNASNLEAENIGIEFCKNLLGENTNWKQTSYNKNFRKNYAGIGYFYDKQRDAFIPPNPECHSEIYLDEQTCLWICENEEHKNQIVEGS